MVVFDESWVIHGRSWRFRFVTPAGKFGMHISIGWGNRHKVLASDLRSCWWKAMKDLVGKSVILSQWLKVHRAFWYSKELSMWGLPDCWMLWRHTWGALYGGRYIMSQWLEDGWKLSVYHGHSIWPLPDTILSWKKWVGNGFRHKNCFVSANWKVTWYETFGIVRCYLYEAPLTLFCLVDGPMWILFGERILWSWWSWIL